jgi:hypothetical protein
MQYEYRNDAVRILHQCFLYLMLGCPNKIYLPSYNVYLNKTVEILIVPRTVFKDKVFIVQVPSRTKKHM